MEERYRAALEAIVAVWEGHAPYWRDEVSDEMAALARSALEPEAEAEAVGLS